MHKRDLVNWHTFAGLSIEETSRITTLSATLIRKEIKAGRIKAIRVGERRLIIPVAAVRELLAGEDSD